MSKTVIFITADERANAGERDYMKAMAAVLAQRARISDRLLFFKTQAAENQEAPLPSDALPVNDDLYARIPAFTSHALSEISGDVLVIGNGHSTLETMNAAVTQLKKRGANVESAYVTHMISSPEDLKSLISEGTHVFAPISSENLQDLGGDEKNLKLITLDAVPHTNTEAACRIDAAYFEEKILDEPMRKALRNGETFAFAVLNAGFKIGDEWNPYFMNEASRHGYALGLGMPADTHLILVDGGPRNGLDEKNSGQKNMQAFVDGYKKAQKSKGADPLIATDRFEPGLPYNAIKAGYLLAQQENCLAFISNAEGYGTMDSAVRFIDNKKKILGMCPFSALYADPTGQREANIDLYNKRGIAVLDQDATGQMNIKRAPDETKTPLPTQSDAAETILRKTGILPQLRAGGPVPDIKYTAN